MSDVEEDGGVDELEVKQHFRPLSISPLVMSKMAREG